MGKVMSQQYYDYMKMIQEMMPAGGPTPEMIEERRRNPLRPPLPEDLECEEVRIRGTRCIWARVEDAPKDKVVIYIHGGGFEFSTAEMCVQFTAELTRRSRLNTLAVEYRALPDHPYPIPLFDCVAAYLGLLDQGYAPERIAVIGESAGGALTANLPVLLKTMGMPVPKAVAPMSCSFENFRNMDFTGYSDHVDPENGILCPIYADLTGYPHTYLSNGTDGLDALLLEGTEQFREKLLEADVACTLDVLEGLGHAPVLDTGRYPEADEALELLIGFLKRELR